MAKGPELLLKPTHGLIEERRGFLREGAALLAKLLEAPLHHGFGEFFLGFEVVVDIAYRHAGRLGDVRQTRLSETASIRQLRRSLNQSRSLVRLCRSHILLLGGVSYLTNSDPAYMMFNSTIWIQVFSTECRMSLSPVPNTPATALEGGLVKSKLTCA